MPTTSAPTRARYVVAAAIGRAAERFPDLPPTPLELTPLSPPERQLAVSIHRTTLQRWLTLEYLVNRVSKTPVEKMEPMLQGVLLTGAAQLLFLRVPGYAVVDEAVDTAARLVRPGAKGLVNAVLRKIGDMVGRVDETLQWTLSRDRLPRDRGSLMLRNVSLPHPANIAKHLPVASSHGEPLVQHWLKRHGSDTTTSLCLHDLQNPPTIVAVEPGLDTASGNEWVAHEREGFVVWKGGFDDLREFLAGDRRRRVQDPAASLAAEATRDLSPKVVLDYCAGRGTKSRQLALLHPGARVLATDPDEARLALAAEAAEPFPNIEIVTPESARGERVDLLLLDVPCSNTGVLARRPEAKYRFSPNTLADVVALQRRIIDETLPIVKPGGYVLYTSCSLEQEENEAQARYLREATRGRIVREGSVLPGGAGPTYHDGSYHALVSVP